ncbi:MAG: hypothetical protein JWP34_5313 [Massilia sp.]|nr:hypothetical protein [Massilia sp.]
MNKAENNKDTKKNQAGNKNNAHPATAQNPQPEPLGTNAPLHEEFSWLSRDEQHILTAQAAASAMDAFRGIATCLQLVEMSDLDRAMQESATVGDIRPILSVRDTSRLMRLAIQVAEVWGERSEFDIRGAVNVATAGSAA